MFIAAGVVLLAGCTLQPGQWVWSHPDADYVDRFKSRDIEKCERYAEIHHIEGPFPASGNPRGPGGWGDFDFEYCMREKGWRLELR
jgi:hypothetical protein